MNLSSTMEAVNTEGIEQIDNILSDTTEITTILETIDLMSESEINLFFSKIYELVSDTITTLCNDDDVSFFDEEEKQNDTQKLSNEVNKLKRISGLLMKCIENSKIKSSGFFDIVQALHDIMIPLDDTIPGAITLKSSISRICEKLWVSEIEGGENLVTQLIPYLLIAALGPASYDTDVKRLFNIRSALYLLDFDDPSIESIRSLILRCFVHPAFLRVAEGRRFLSFLFTIHEGLNSLIIEVMKPQIATASRSVTTAYGEILFRAWKEVPAPKNDEDISVTLESMEEGLQGLFHDAIHAADHKYFKGLRIVLGALHESKRLKGVDSLLLRIYGPILWRSLRCANALVRAQATVLFFDAFPLQNSDTSAVESDAILQKQFDLLSSLLKDTDHRVRAAAASGVCHILREYWEALPSQTTRQILTYVVGTLGHDSSCATVRLAVITGLGKILDQPLAHTVLKSLLPLVSNALHDKSQAVRVAFIAILNKVKNIRGLHFCDIVSVEHLQCRLAEDCSKQAICLGMTELLLSSYYPQQTGDSKAGVNNNNNQLQRCLQFVKENVGASVAFYSTFYKFTSIGSASKLLVMLFALFTKPNYFKDYCESAAEKDSSSETQKEAAVAKISRKSKRDRANSAVSTTDNDGDDIATAVVVTTLSMSEDVFKVAVLQVMLSCLVSISSGLSRPEHLPSRELLLKYFTTASVQLVILSLSSKNDDEDETLSSPKSTEALPLFLEIVSLVWRLRSDDDNADCNLSAKDVLMEWHNSSQKAQYNQQGNQSKESREVYTSQSSSITHAKAVVAFVFTIGQGDSLLEEIKSSFNNQLLNTNNKNIIQNNQCKSLHPLEICSSPEPSNRHKGKGGKRKPKAIFSPGFQHEDIEEKEEALISLSNTTELLSVIIESKDNFINENSQEINKIFTVIRNTIDIICDSQSSYDHLVQTDEEDISGGMAIETVLVRCIHLWSLYALQQAATILSNSSSSTTSCNSITSTDDNDDSVALEGIEVLLSWVTTILLPFICGKMSINIQFSGESNGNNNSSSSTSSSSSSSNQDIPCTPEKYPAKTKTRVSDTPTSVLTTNNANNLNNNNGNDANNDRYVLIIRAVEAVLLVMSDGIVIEVAVEQICSAVLNITNQLQNLLNSINNTNTINNTNNNSNNSSDNNLNDDKNDNNNKNINTKEHPNLLISVLKRIRHLLQPDSIGVRLTAFNSVSELLSKITTGIFDDEKSNEKNKEHIHGNNNKIMNENNSKNDRITNENHDNNNENSNSNNKNENNGYDVYDNNDDDEVDFISTHLKTPSKTSHTPIENYFSRLEL